MKKYLISLVSLFSVSTSSAMVVSCGGAPNGKEVQVYWQGTSSDDQSKSLPYLPEGAVLPVFNMLNSTKESRSEASKPDDGMTTDQIQNSIQWLHDNNLDKFQKLGEGTAANDFYNDWFSNNDYYYSSVMIENSSTISWKDQYDLATGKVTKGSVPVTDNVNKALNYLNDNFADKGTLDSGKWLAYANINPSSSSSWKTDTTTMQLTFQGSKKYTVEVAANHLVADLGLVNYSDSSDKEKSKDHYEWFVVGYSYVGESQYPINLYPDSNSYFTFVQQPTKQNNNNVQYKITKISE